MQDRSRWNTDTPFKGGLLSPIQSVQEEASHSPDQSCTCMKFLGIPQLICGVDCCYWGQKEKHSIKVKWQINKVVLLNKFSMLLLFCPSKKFIYFMCCWDVSSQWVMHSAVGFACTGWPCTGARGLNGIRISYQTARCAFPIRKREPYAIHLWELRTHKCCKTINRTVRYYGTWK